MRNQLPGVRFGLLLGLFSLMLMLAFYYIDKSFLYKPIMITRFALMAGCMWLAVAATRQMINAEDTLPFKIALQQSFLTAVIGNLIYALAQHILFKYIDPDMVTQMIDYTVHRFEHAGRTFTEDQIEQIRKQTISKSISGYVFSLLGSFVVAAIISALAPKK